MNFEPQKFFVGLMDFFSILLPGALLTYLLMGEVGPVVLGDRYAQLAGAKARGNFLFVSYLFGQLVFLLRSCLDEFYDWAWCYTLDTQMTLVVARRDRCVYWAARDLIWIAFKAERRFTNWHGGMHFLTHGSRRHRKVYSGCRLVDRERFN